ncbi:MULTISPECIES: hypothetical protein [unclassified Gemella]|uniref:hypothetical protein n=1 Tax=unclassified Gemella TaxID=2624949 RepID=UPI001073DB30|nr:MULTISPECIES: hypothetical protein [unclassified Gemella]MBF0709749.1 hypothetical protein [Gemella sp. GL1.1]MBF0747267.1 hypothetical protein [Gemella sp. 19428wG2_WT2a]NYS27093.1 hypothetical protein [Gemella sp. GL1]TFU57852.1 hypothetical protein E4T67_06305 [Gemella sp. WT2a]
MIAKIQFRENEKIYYYYTDKKDLKENDICLLSHKSQYVNSGKFIGYETNEKLNIRPTQFIIARLDTKVIHKEKARISELKEKADKKRDLEKEILKATEELVKLKMEQAKYD